MSTAILTNDRKPFRSHPEERARYIKDQERARATGATESQRLPWKGRSCLNEYNFVFGEQVDEIYVTVTTWPEGFTVKHMDDPRGFWIIGPDGKTVAQGMIKDIPYDRYAAIWKVVPE